MNKKEEKCNVLEAKLNLQIPKVTDYFMPWILFGHSYEIYTSETRNHGSFGINRIIHMISFYFLVEVLSTHSILKIIHYGSFAILIIHVPYILGNFSSFLFQLLKPTALDITTIA